MPDPDFPDDAPLPPGMFLATMPWSVLRVSGDGPAGYVVIDATDGSTCLALFTDDDLAERFVRDAGVTADVAAVDSPAAFAELVLHLPPICTHASFDPPATVGGRARWVVPLTYLLRVLRRHDG
ncbi:MAG TPA: hypothetical protein VF796_05355 [Humisphaera sp.]